MTGLVDFRDRRKRLRSHVMNRFERGGGEAIVHISTAT
jgi:hypothetical protein